MPRIKMKSVRPLGSLVTRDLLWAAQARRAVFAYIEILYNPESAACARSGWVDSSVGGEKH
jgi:hypothetical protein